MSKAINLICRKGFFRSNIVLVLKRNKIKYPEENTICL